MVAKRKPRIHIPGMPHPPLLTGESAEAYDFFVAQFRDDIKPEGFLENILVADLTYVTWEILRYRRIKIALMQHDLDCHVRSPFREPENDQEESAETQNMDDVDQDDVDQDDVDQDDVDQDDVDQYRSPSVVATAFRISLNDVQALEALISLAEARRSKILYEISFFRSNFASSAQETSDRALNENVPRVNKAIANRKRAHDDRKAAGRKPH